MILEISLLALLILFSSYVAYRVYRHIPVNDVAKWARKNKRTARWMLVAFNLALSVLGVTIGLLCSSLDLQMSEGVLYAGLGFFAIGTILYPSKKKGTSEIVGRLGKRRWMTGLRLAGGAVASIAFANIFISGEVSLVTSEAYVHPAVWIVLSTIGLLALGFGILVLSCGLACSGYESAALLLAIGGTGGLVFLYVFVILKIIKNNKKNKELEKEGSAEFIDQL